MSRTKYLFLFVLFTGLYSCGIIRQADEMQTFSKCKFKMRSVRHLRLAGVDVQKIKDYKQLSVNDISKLTTAAVKGELPLNFTLNLQVVNPNSKTAAINKLDWILYIDDIEMNRGEIIQRVEIPSGDTAELPLKMEVYLKKILKGKTFKSIVNFGLNLADDTGKPTRITIKVKPSLIVAGQEIVYPDYIVVKNEI